MKVRIINAKNLLKYFSKILALLAIFAVFGKFFYGNKNSNVNFKINSSNLLSMVGKEISLFKEKNKSNDDTNKIKYAEKTVNGELEFIKMVASNNYIYSNNNSDNGNGMSNLEENIENSLGDTDLTNENIDNQQENIAEPQTRFTNRGFAIKCSR